MHRTETVKRIKKVEDAFKEVEDAILNLIEKANTLNPDRLGFNQQKAILGIQNSCRGLQGWELGELKTAFGIGCEQAMVTKEHEELRDEIEAMSSNSQ